MGLRVVKQYFSAHEAYIARSYLVHNDIIAWVQDDQFIQLDWYRALAIGPVKLCVIEDDLDRAEQLLDEVEHRYRQNEENKCPDCSSSNTIRYRRYTIGHFLLAIIFIFYFPYLIPPNKFGYLKCFQCKKVTPPVD